MIKGKTGAGVRTACQRLNFSDDFQRRLMLRLASSVRRFVRSTEWGKAPNKVRVKTLLSANNVNDQLVFCERMRLDGFCDPIPQSRIKRPHVLFTNEGLVLLPPVPNRQNMRTRKIIC